MTTGVYTSRLGAGLGLIEETDALLDLWQPEMSGRELYLKALDSGAFPSMSARRLEDVVMEGFGARYLVDEGLPASTLKQVRTLMSAVEFRQLLLIYTARSHGILFDFITEVYWPTYAAGKTEIERSDSVRFVERSNQDGKTTTRWSESTVRRVSSYLIGCCVDFGLLESTRSKMVFEITSCEIKSRPALLLSYGLHFSGLGDNAILNHRDWQLFGLEASDVIHLLQSLSRDGHFVVQAAGGVVNISWNYVDMQGVIDVIGR